MKKIFYILLFVSCFSPQIFTQIQQQFCRNGLNINILQLAYTKDSLLVSVGNSCTVVDVNMIIDTIVHTWDADMRMYLQKGTASVMIINQVGGSGDNFINTKLNDSASIPISGGTAPFTGSFRPSNPLTPFNGINASGYWRYVIVDTTSGDTGMLRAWCIQVTFTCPTGGIQTLEIPNSYRLYQNYPNPFNPVTKIKYGLPKAGYVKLTIYNELGEEVAQPVNEFKEANSYESVFDATNLPSGVYYYKLEVRQAGSETEGFTDTKKMVILK